MKDVGQDHVGMFLHQEMRNAFHLSGMTLLSITSIYLHKFIIPSIGIIEPTPGKLKLS